MIITKNIEGTGPTIAAVPAEIALEKEMNSEYSPTRSNYCQLANVSLSIVTYLLYSLLELFRPPHLPPAALVHIFAPRKSYSNCGRIRRMS